jgi:L-asparaginase
MRPNSALSADGPSNFYDAVRTAVHPEARDRGALIAFNDHLVSAFYATKTNGNTVTTFLSSDQGYIAQFMSGQPYFFYGASLPKGRHYFDPFKLTQPLPKVDLLYGYRKFLRLPTHKRLVVTAKASLKRVSTPIYFMRLRKGAPSELQRRGDESSQIHASNSFRGIVIMGVGPGALSTAATNAAADLYSRGIITVASFRPFFGATVPSAQPLNMYVRYVDTSQGRGFVQSY